MKDRIPVNPGRVLITPENGAAAYYATMTRADNPMQEGDSLSKNTLLKDSTAEALGLTETALPDDALRVLSRLHSGLGNEYVWAKNTLLPVIATTASTNAAIIPSSGTGYSIRYSDTVGVVDGNLTLTGNVQTINSPVTNSSVLNVLAGKYFITNYNVYKDLLMFADAKGTSWITSACGFQPIYAVSSEAATVGYVNSPDPNAYPPAEDDGFTYTALGMLGEKIRIEAGSYVGTGKYDGNYPNSITLGFDAKIVIISPAVTKDTSGKATYYGLLFPSLGKGLCEMCAGSSTSIINVSSAGGVISWYSNLVTVQLNQSGVTYNYVAVG